MTKKKNLLDSFYETNHNRKQLVSIFKVNYNKYQPKMKCSNKKYRICIKLLTIEQ